MEIELHLKHAIKRLIGKADPAWDQYTFEQSIDADTWKNRRSVLGWAENALVHPEQYESEEAYARSHDPIVLQGHELKKEAERKFKDKYAAKTGERILIHIPDEHLSPAGYSLFTNFKEAFNFIGVPTKSFHDGDSFAEKAVSFKPTVFLSSDHPRYLNQIDWQALAEFRQKSGLKTGLTASLQEYGSSPLPGRLTWAKEHGINFYYSFRDPEYVKNRKEYGQFFDAGYKILYLPFGAHISHYYPVALPDSQSTPIAPVTYIIPTVSTAPTTHDLDFAYLASKKSNAEGWMREILSKHSGFIDGPGWRRTTDFKFNRNRDRYIYARAKIGLNLHLHEQIEWACEVNERTYQLAVCGVPQLTDHAKLLDKLFEPEALFIADTPAEYAAQFEYMLANPELATARALKAQKEVFEKYTTYHRAEAFLLQLRALV